MSASRTATWAIGPLSLLLLVSGCTSIDQETGDTEAASASETETDAGTGTDAASAGTDGATSGESDPTAASDSQGASSTTSDTDSDTNPTAEPTTGPLPTETTGGLPTCTEHETQETCEADVACDWATVGGVMQCVNAGGDNCEAFNMQMCQAVLTCAWDPETMACSPA